jgi:homoserine kinase type II
MAVYTPVSDEQLQAFFAQYDCGDLLEAKGILQGVENTNYYIRTEKYRAILTLFEKRVRAEAVPFFMDLMAHLAAKGIPCPRPLADKTGKIIHTLCERSAAVVSFLDGSMTPQITPDHCRQVGMMTARMHQAVVDFEGHNPNDLAVEGWARLVDAVAPRANELTPDLAELLRDELALQKNHAAEFFHLPRGIIHADLFQDNIFFDAHGQLSGVIDFYFACTDAFVYDLAITINAWCFDEMHSFVHSRFVAMMEGYQAVRALNDDERAALPVLLRGAALRFLLTRSFDWLNHPPDAFVTPKDPLEYYTKLRFFRDRAISV